MGDDEKFKWSDVWSFKTSFWLLTVSCVVTYASVFPFIQIASDLVQKKYGFDEDEAGNLCFIPYWFSAALSPFLGFGLDKFGHRAILISLSSVILIAAFAISMNLPPCTDKCYNELGPLCMVGVAYSIYAAAIWGSIPYVVLPHTVGTAFGLAMAVQNIGLSFAPSIVAYIKDNTKRMYGYYYVEMFFIGVNIIGLTCNIALYYVDIKYNNGILDKVDKGDGL